MVSTLVHRGYRFKLKTTSDMEAVFRTMVGHARFVWNKALRLNLDRLEQGLPIVWYNDLCGLLRLWKQSEEYGFLAEANAQSLQQKLRDLDRAFTDAFDTAEPMKRLPRFKKRGVGGSFRLPQDVKVENRRVFLPKIGWVGFFKSCEVPGTIKNATVTREADGWYVSIQTEAEIPEPNLHIGPAIGVDRGVAVFAATSDGELVDPVNSYAKSMERLARLQRKLARQSKGSRNRAKTKARIARLHQSIRRQRADFLHKVSTRWSKSHALIVLEDLRIGNMTRSAKGTVDRPGSHVVQKSGLNRAILDQGWGEIGRMLAYKLPERGAHLLLAPPQQSSQECSECGHVAPENRSTRGLFRCVACGYTEHADVNAAKIVLSRGLWLLEHQLAG